MIESEWESVDLYRLFQLFQQAMERFKEDKNRVTHKIVNFPYSVEGQREFISEIVERKEKASFGDVFGDMVNRLHAIVTFLALLDLINTQKIRINVGEDRKSTRLNSSHVAISYAVF